MTEKTAPRRINARRILAASALALGASGAMVQAQTATQPAAAVENGEAGETGVILDPGADLGLYLANIDVMEARTNLLQQLVTDAKFEEAAQLAAIMKQAFAADLQEQVAHHAEDFTEAFKDLDKALAQQSPEDAMDAIDWLRMEFEEAREDNTPAPHAAFSEIAALVRAVTNIVAGGSDPLTLAQASAVLDVARARNQAFVGATDAKQAQVAAEIAAQIALLTPVLTNPPAEGLDTSLFYGAAARVEISAQKVR